MAEKEERILIEYYRPIKELNDGSEDRIMNKLTRAEAIEKMAKAIAIPYFEGVHSCENEAIEDYAEAALNALLWE